MERVVRTTVCVLLLAGAAAWTPPTARADYEETEHRLKTAGIEEPLRRSIHAAIEKGVAYLLSRQAPDGGIDAPVHWLGGRPPRGLRDVPSASSVEAAGYTVLCALALRHADTPKARKGLSRARSFLFKRKDVRTRLLHRTYEGGLAAMLVMADGGPEDLARDLAHDLARHQASNGWWGYGPSVGSADGGPINLSTTQFAALGLWAVSRMGNKVPRHVWKRLARTHCRTQSEDGSWGYQPRRMRRVFHRYPQGTFMGIANLLLAEAAMRKDLEHDKRLRKDITAAKKKGLGSLAREGADFLGHFCTWDASGAFDPSTSISFPFYTLYALEKACVFAGIERCGAVPWYRKGAEALIARQQADGSWGPVRLSWDGPPYEEDALACTAFALLFLLRASTIYCPAPARPVTPRASGSASPVPDKPEKKSR